MPIIGFSFFVYYMEILKVRVQYLCALIEFFGHNTLRLHPKWEQGEECDEGCLNNLFHPE